MIKWTDYQRIITELVTQQNNQNSVILKKPHYKEVRRKAVASSSIQGFIKTSPRFV